MLRAHASALLASFACSYSAALRGVGVRGGARWGRDPGGARVGLRGGARWGSGSGRRAGRALLAPPPPPRRAGSAARRVGVRAARSGGCWGRGLGVGVGQGRVDRVRLGFWAGLINWTAFFLDNLSRVL